MAGLLRTEGIVAGRASYLPAPVLEDAIGDAFSTGATAHSLATSGLTVATFRPFVFSGWLADSATFTSLLGSSDDTSAAVALYDTNPRINLREMTVVGGLDANWTLTVGASTRAAMVAVSLSGIGSIPTPATNNGAGAALPSCAAFGVTGGPKSLLVIDAAMIRGAHVTNPPTVPATYTLVDSVRATGSDNPSSTSHGTLIVGQKSYLHSDLAWTGDAATIPAATFGGLADIGTVPWRTIRFVVLAA